MKFALAKSVLMVALVTNPLSAQTRGSNTGQFPAPISLMNFSPNFRGHPGGVKLLNRTSSPAPKPQFWFHAGLATAGKMSVSPSAADSLRFDAKLEASAMQIQPSPQPLGTLKFVPAAQTPKTK